MPDHHFSRLADRWFSSAVGWVHATAGWVEARLGMARLGMAGLANDHVARPIWSLIATLASVMLYIGLRVAGWDAAAQWMLAAAIVIGTLAVALQLLVELDDGIECPPDHAGFSDDPDELDAQLAEMRPVPVVRAAPELPVYSQCCASLAFDPLAGAGVR